MKSCLKVEELSWDRKVKLEWLFVFPVGSKNTRKFDQVELKVLTFSFLMGELQRNEGEKSQWLWLHGKLTQIVGMLSSSLLHSLGSLLPCSWLARKDTSLRITWSQSTRKSYLSLNLRKLMVFFRDKTHPHISQSVLVSLVWTDQSSLG